MNPLFNVDIENLNFIQLAYWIKQCRLAVSLSNSTVYGENPQRYYKDVSLFCNEYKSFFEENKDLMTGKVFKQALKLSVMPAPRYLLVSSDGIEIDVTTEMEQMQFQNMLSSTLVSKSIDREADRVKRYAQRISSFTSGKREALHGIINHLSLETVTYRVAVLEKADKLKDKDIQAAIRDIKRGKWQVTERTLKPAEGKTLSDYLLADIRANHINKNVFYPFVKNKGENRNRIYGKLFLYNVGFYIGLTATEMEQVLRNEGNTMQLSLRPDDHIVYQSFYYSFSREYASALLKKDGYNGLEIGNG